MKITGIILAAGSSSRYGKNKILEKINNKYILEYSLDVFCNSKKIDNIIIVTKEDIVSKIEKIINKYNKDIKIVIGGKIRKESVYNALISTNSDIVIVHDGARPVINIKEINSLLREIGNYKGVALGVKSRDTVKILDDDNIVINSTNRDNTYLAQTPQVFDRDLLIKLHEKYKDKEVTDDCMLLELDKIPVKIVEGSYKNIKLTYKEDKEIIKNYLK